MLPAVADRRPQQPTTPAGLAATHIEDLLQQLRCRAKELDRREGVLHTAMALQDARERQFRLEAEEQNARLDEREAALLRFSEQLRQEARRMAICEPHWLVHPDRS